MAMKVKTMSMTLTPEQREKTASLMWDALVDGPSEREGVGTSLAIWVCKNKTRKRRREEYEDGRYEEESKAIKDPNAAQRKSMLEFAARNPGSFQSEFLRTAATAPEKAPDKDVPGALVDKKKIKKAVNLAEACPKAITLQAS